MSLRCVVAAVLFAVGASACAGGAVSTRDGYVTTDDGVRLYYKIVGDGAETVVIPVGLYLEDLLAPLARPGRRLVFYDPRHRGRSGLARRARRARGTPASGAGR